MKFSLPFTLALATAIAPALATESVATSGCKGNEWPIAVPADSKDGSKKTTFSKPFYVGSLKCQLAQ
ncbi:hypothetical protein N7512_010259 [Penicillium capsulatum]|nr:hypothetical protein N7512_010259 [Penicillium capsulatum]